MTLHKTALSGFSPGQGLFLLGVRVTLRCPAHGRKPEGGNDAENHDLMQTPIAAIPVPPAGSPTVTG